MRDKCGQAVLRTFIPRAIPAFDAARRKLPLQSCHAL
jgi:hypothetical protein